MRFDVLTFTGGMVAGVCSVFATWAAIDLGVFDGSYVCDSGETVLTCARSWSNVAAILAGAGTIFLLAREQADGRRNRRADEKAALENAVFLSLPIRACLADAAATCRVIDETMTQYDDARSQALHLRVFFNDPRQVVNPLRRAHKLLGGSELQRATEYEGRFAFGIEELRDRINTAVSMLYDEEINLDELDGAGFTARIVVGWQRSLTNEIFAEIYREARDITRRLRHFEEAVRTQTLLDYFADTAAWDAQKRAAEGVEEQHQAALPQ